MSKLDDIFNSFAYTDVEQIDTSNRDDFRQQIKDLFLGLIGEDDKPIARWLEPLDADVVEIVIKYRNQLRADQRKQLEKL